ncbi:MAG TPA: GNAT family N-acetyltransferase, partial [Lysobacter sp.]|nr:GNAT family N-acetyltransferase [Lysobacter sp.]
DHDRTGFTCGSEALDRYFREQASQDTRRRTSACYVAIHTETGAIAGYYTLAAGGVPLTEVPEAMAKKLPRYPSVPVARLGRLAVASRFQRRQLGAALLWDAAQRAVRSEVAVYALVVDAKDDAAAAFYLHHGFIAFGVAPRQFVLPLASLAKKN